MNENMIEPIDPEKFPIITNYCENLTTKEYVTIQQLLEKKKLRKLCLFY